MTKLPELQPRNWIGGEWVEPETDAARRRRRSGHRRGASSGPPASGAADVDRAVQAAAKAFESWSATTPRQRAEALLRIAQVIEDHNDEFTAIESANVGKPVSALPDEMDLTIDNFRFFAGGARAMEGRPAGEYMAGYTSWLRREPLGVVGPDRPLELPADDGGVEDRPGAGRRQHRGAQAVRAHAAVGAAAGRAHRRRPPARRTQRGHRSGGGGRRGVGGASGGGHGVAHRFGSHRPGGHAGGGRRR